MPIPESLYDEVLRWHDGHKAYSFGNSYAFQSFEWMLIDRNNQVFRARTLACVLSYEIVSSNELADQALKDLVHADGWTADAD